MQYIKGPDFPTAGIIMGTKGIREAYSTGRGKYIFVPVPKLLRIRATDLKLLLQSFLIRLKRQSLFLKLQSLQRIKSLKEFPI